MRLFPLVLFLVVMSACGGHESGTVSGEAIAAEPVAGGAGSAAADASGLGPANRLIHEKSPYLQQHAHNLVDWYPWGPEALERARAENKLIFLSIGYFSCHWCHVMERESFMNTKVAAVLNEHFVSIKVDREERPDVDHIYLSAVQAMTGRAGWPLTVVLNPDLKPFFGGTYFPPDDFRGQKGLAPILLNLNQAWRERPEEIEARGDELVTLLAAQVSGAAPADSAAPLDLELLDRAYDTVLGSFDREAGGFGRGMKFPTPHKLAFLLRHAHRTEDPKALEMVRRTLDAMAAGGIHDHLGGGFHRYTIDAQWLVPHFEKMLYDQAGLALVYLDAWRVTREPAYRAMTEEILDYVLRDLSGPAGGFCAAEDADSEGREGAFYLWSATAIDSVLGPERGFAFRGAYRVTVGGDVAGKNVLNLAGYDPEVVARFADDRARLSAARDLRPRPARDEKIIAAWNGAIIEALAEAGAALDEPRYLAAAEEAAQFVLSRLWTDGRLKRFYRDGTTDTPAYLDDYVYLGRGLLALYEATQRPEWLRHAKRAAEETHRLFARDEGGYALTGRDAEPLVTPVVQTTDGAVPSGNGVAAGFFSRLGHLTGDSELENRGWAVLEAFAGDLERSPVDFLEMLSAADFELGVKTEVVIAGDPGDAGTRAMLRAVSERYLPNTVTALHPIAGGEEIVSLIPYLEAQTALDGKPTGYVCRDYVCRLPVQDVKSLVRELEAR